ncbi:flavodoxin [Oscillibacter sp.]|uniref:flavodoxin n=1 Tax=Oscillibacter sp. TaxID=1945593 RepID=UPI002D7FCECD|nr:flavodoxin [Oscillibacter sp.]
MKKLSFLLVALALLLSLAACGPAQRQDDAASVPAPEASPPSQLESSAPAQGGENPESDSRDSKILIAYFSATNNTENIANHLYEILDADLVEIVPEQPYTSDDLNYNDSSSRSSLEMNDPDARPAISGSVDNIEQYDMIFLGFPIWWGEAPKIVSTFLESYDLSGKTIVPFCTSASSPMGSSAAKLQELTDGAAWLEGRRFSGGASAGEVQSWVDSLDLDG